MGFLKDVNGTLLIAGLGALVMLGSFLVWAMAYALFAAFGMNDDVAFVMSFLIWLGAVMALIYAMVSFYNKNFKNRGEPTIVNNVFNNTVERVTVIQEAPAQQAGGEIPGNIVEAGPYLDDPQRYGGPVVDSQPMLVDGDKSVEPESQPFESDPPPFEDKPSTPAAPPAPSVSYRSLLREENQEDDLK